MRYLIFGLLVFWMTACGNSEPDCIDTRIDQFKMDQKDCVGARIAKYRFEGDILYGFSDGQCIADGGTSLVDEDCSNVCFIGGIAALTDCNGVPFEANAELIEVMWDN